MKKLIVLPIMMGLLMIILSMNTLAPSTVLESSTANMTFSCSNKTSAGVANPYPMGYYNGTALCYSNMATPNEADYCATSIFNPANCDGGLTAGVPLAQMNFTLFGIKSTEVDWVNFTYWDASAWLSFAAVSTICVWNQTAGAWTTGENCRILRTTTSNLVANSTNFTSVNNPKDLFVDNGENSNFIVGINHSHDGFRPDYASLTVHWTDIVTVDNGSNNVTLVSPFNNSNWNSSQKVAFQFNASASAVILDCDLWTNDSVNSGWGVKQGNQTRIVNNQTNSINLTLPPEDITWNVLCNTSDGNLNFSRKNSTFYSTQYDAANWTLINASNTFGRLANYTWKVSLNSSTIQTTKLQPDCGDIRVRLFNTTSNSNGRFLDFYLENCSSPNYLVRARDYNIYPNSTNLSVNVSYGNDVANGSGDDSAMGQRINLTASYDFTNISNISQINDLSPNRFNGSVGAGNGSFAYTKGVFGNGIRFVPRAHLNITRAGSGAVNQVEPERSYGIMFWINFSDLSIPVDRTPYLWDWLYDDITVYFVQPGSNQVGSAQILEWKDGDGAVTNKFIITGNISENEYNHFALTFNGTHKATFLNGNLMVANGATADAGGVVSVFILGQGVSGALSANYRTAEFDEFRFYGSNVTPEEIRAEAWKAYYTFSTLENLGEGVNSSLNITLRFPTNATTNTTSRVINFTYNVSASATVLSCELWNNETSWGTKIGNQTRIDNNLTNWINYTFATDSTYLWNVLCNTSDGNLNFSVKNFSIVINTLNNGTNNVTLKVPNNATWNNTRNINFTFNASASADTLSCEVWTNETSWGTKTGNQTRITNNATNWINNSFNSDGNYLWNVLCNTSDGNLNFSVKNYTIYVDITIPEINFTTPINTNRSFVNRNWLFVNISTTELNIHSYRIHFDATNYTTPDVTLINNGDTTQSFYRNFTALADGNHSFYGWVNDSVSGNNQTENRTVTVDTTIPKVNFSNPTDANGTYSNRNWTLVNITITEVNVDTYRIFFDGTNYTTPDVTIISNGDGTQSFYRNFTGVSDGNHSFYGWINDSVDWNNQTENRTITVDTLIPKINYTIPINVNKSFMNRNWIFVNVTTTELNIHSYKIYFNGTNYTNADLTLMSNGDTTQSFYANFTGLSDKNYSFYGWVNDSAGWSNQTENRTVSVDTTFPTIAFSSINTDGNGTYSNRNWTMVNFTFTEVNPDKVIINFNGTNYTTATINNYGDNSGFFYINFTELVPSRNWSFYGWINDSAGSSAQTLNRTILLNQPPTITINSPPNLYALNRNITFNYSITDADGDTLNCSLMFNSTPQSTNASVKQGLSYNITSAVDNNVNGDFLATINCTDRINSTNSSSLTVRIDTVNPIITTTYPTQSNNKTGNSSNFTFDISVEDNNLLQFEINVTNSSRTQDIYYKLFDQINTTTESSNAKINFTYEDRYNVFLAATDDHTKEIKPQDDYNISKDLADLKLTFTTTENFKGRKNNIGIKLKSADLNLTDFGAVKNPTNDSYSFFFKFAGVENGSVRKFTFKLSANETIVYRANSSLQSHFVTGGNFAVFQLANGVNSVQQVTPNPQGQNSWEISIWTSKVLLNFTE